MSVTNTETNLNPAKPIFWDKMSVVLDSSYPTGGEALDIQAAIGEHRTIVSVIPVRLYTTSTGVPALYRLAWDSTNEKIYVIQANGGGELAAATDLSTYTAEFLVCSQ